MDIALQDTIYHQQIHNCVEVTKFTLEELQESLTQDIDSEFYELMCEPYIWGMVADDVSGLEYSLDKCIERYILNGVKMKSFPY